MDQRQFKIRMSLSTKLLLTISFLLATPIFFLNLSAITLFRNDKKAYVYDSQATASALAGREFVSYLDNALGTMKLVLGSIDLEKSITQQTKNNIQFYLDNQHSLVGTEVYGAVPPELSATLVYQQFLPSTLQQLGIKMEDVHFDTKALASHAKELLAAGYFFENVSKPGSPPILLLGLADLNRTKVKGAIPVAIGFLSLQHFMAGSTNGFNRFIIADRAGSVLFHSDIKSLYEHKGVGASDIFLQAWSSTVNSGAKEYENEGVRTLGSFYKPGLELVALSEIEYDKAMQATYMLTEQFIVLGVAALGIMIVLGLIFSKRLTAPVNRLFRATAQVSSGNFNVNLPVSSHDEIGALTNSFVAMSRRISDLVQEMVDKVRVDQELEIAKTVQQSLFPPTVIENENVRIVSHYESASECGGDWWGYFRTGAKHVVIIADATGHGLPSALMTASARSCFSVIEKLTAETRLGLNPSEMLSIANRVVYDSAQGKIMMTCFACVIDFETHTLSFSSAAHNPPWVFSKQADGMKMTSLVARGTRLGEGPEAAPYEIKQVQFALGDTIAFYTDGLLEGKNLSGEQYGKKQSRAILEETIHHDPQKIISVLMADFMAHNKGKALDDDVTLAMVRILS